MVGRAGAELYAAKVAGATAYAAREAIVAGLRGHR